MTAGDRLFGDMSEPVHAYALGVVAAAGRDRQGVLEIAISEDARSFVELLQARRAGDIPVSYELSPKRVRVGRPLSKQAATWLGALPGDETRLEFPALPQHLSGAFLRGLFDGAGHISSPRKASLTVRLERPGPRFLEGLLDFLPIAPDRLGKRHLRWRGHNALDLLGHIYDDATLRNVPYRRKLLERYRAWARRVPPFASSSEVGSIRWRAVHADARPPFKQRISDSGYDLTLLYEVKRLGRCVLYGTGLVIEPPFGWYLDVVPRSSIIKTGHILANNVGVIDRGYRGEILVPLIKIDPDAPDLPLPARVTQMVPRPIVHLGLERATRSSQSHRGAGGFGSTG